jgi:hypothetical protein
VRKRAVNKVRWWLSFQAQCSMAPCRRCPAMLLVKWQQGGGAKGAGDSDALDCGWWAAARFRRSGPCTGNYCKPPFWLARMGPGEARHWSPAVHWRLLACSPRSHWPMEPMMDVHPGLTSKPLQAALKALGPYLYTLRARVVDVGFRVFLLRGNGNGQRHRSPANLGGTHGRLVGAISDRDLKPSPLPYSSRSFLSAPSRTNSLLRLVTIVFP